MTSFANFSPLSSQAEYLCPGERHPISRSLHLARLAAGHPGCRVCRYRQESDGLPRHVAARARSRIERQPPPLVTDDGIRGLYVNQLTRESIGTLVQHILEILAAERARAFDRSARGGLRVLTGYDSRPHSPDLAVGMVAALRRWGCEVADIGLASRPLFDAALDRLRPDAGLFLTGGNHPHAYSGLDILDPTGLPWCHPGQLNCLQDKLATPLSRTGRSSGRYETFKPIIDYQNGLAHHFHAIRPLRIIVGCPNSLVRNSLKAELDQTSCSVLLSTMSTPGERSGNSLIEIMCERRLDVGFLIGADGRTCRLFDEGGHEFSLLEMLTLLQPQTISGSGPAWIARMTESPPEDADAGIRMAGTEAELLQQQREQRIPLAADSEFRFWFLESSPACDAIQTLARTLEVLSLSDRPASTYRTSQSQRRTSQRPLR